MCGCVRLVRVGFVVSGQVRLGKRRLGRLKNKIRLGERILR
jgi:hypothetical protein